jgi:hypothetical protein
MEEDGWPKYLISGPHQVTGGKDDQGSCRRKNYINHDLVEEWNQMMYKIGRRQGGW